MAERRNPTQAELRQLLDYDPRTGVLSWRERTGREASRWNGMYAGKPAGTKNAGYIVLKIYDRNYLAHRVIWAMHFDAWPECIDHINGNPSDNRLKNLRAVSRGINQRNQKMHRSNRSGVTGVCWAKAAGKWLASIKVDNVQRHLGFFEEFQDAVAARKSAEKRFNFTGRV